MKSRSSSANTTAMCAIALPIGVQVSISISVTISRQSWLLGPTDQPGEVFGAAAHSVHLGEDQRLCHTSLQQRKRTLNRLRDSGGTAPDSPSSASHIISQPLASATRSTAPRPTTFMINFRSKPMYEQPIVRLII
jgi:hypothetical protein